MSHPLNISAPFLSSSARATLQALQAMGFTMAGTHNTNQGALVAHGITVDHLRAQPSLFVLTDASGTS